MAAATDSGPISAVSTCEELLGKKKKRRFATFQIHISKTKVLNIEYILWGLRCFFLSITNYRSLVFQIEKLATLKT